MTAPPYRRPRTHGLSVRYDPLSRQGAIYPAIAAGVALLLAVALIIRGLTLGISFAAFLCYAIAVALLVGGALAAYWTFCCLSLSYTLSNGVLSIRYGWTVWETPVNRFDRLVRGRSVGELPVSGLNWPGCHIGRARARGLGAVRVISLHRLPEEALYLTAPDESLGISVGNQEAFIRALQDQIDLPPTIPEPRASAPAIARLLSWRDPPVQFALAASIGLAIATTGVIFSRYAGFPDEIVLNFPNNGDIGSRTTLLGIPLLAWLFVALNGAFGLALVARLRMSAITLLFGLVFVEALLVVASIFAG